MDRHLFLGSLGTAAATTFAGCGRAPSPADGGEERTDSTVASTPVETATPTPEAPEVPLPGPPVRTRSGTLEVQGASTLVDAESQGFDGSAGEYEFQTETQANFDQSEATANPNDDSVSLEVAADHVGTGRAFGLAAGAFQTAWEAPVSGRYRLSSSYTRYADILYDLPVDGDVSASFDTSLLAVSHETGEVNSRRTHPELQHKNGRLRRELAEWFLEVGVTYLVATTFGR